ncbi:MAG: metallophosphoesterase [Bacteroidetes bacterium]|nr:metallophosphoesterase [Bacteroidota bacterium]MBS1539855.1 metallophosphoesterase [Bacteroidota bacterium]
MMTMFFFIILFLLIDIYVFQAVLNVSKEWAPLWKQIFRYGYWLPTLIAITGLVWWAFSDPYKGTDYLRIYVIAGSAIIYFSKLFAVLFLLADDLQRSARWVAQKIFSSKESLPGKSITRSEFLSQAALVASAVPIGLSVYGILTGAHDYRLKKITIPLPYLPPSFDGLRIGQISDIHSGSFWNKTAVKGGVKMLMDEKPDLIFFTGDLVNNESSEVRDYISIFDKVKAPLGVFSVTGNHDYGDYRQWASAELKRKNFSDLVEAHRLLGYDLLMNENRIIKQNGDTLAIIGIENWGAGRFSKYGKLDQAYRGAEEASTKILLSHDPTSWDAIIRPAYQDIDLTLSGHTHGFQFGVETEYIKWSPCQYMYKQWAGLYQEGNQYLYVNRGYGYLGYPGRVGMPPEITIFELKKV